MNKTVLGVAIVVVFCITWWLVAGEAMQAAQQTWQAYEQAEQAHKQAEQAYMQAKPALQQARETHDQAIKQAKQAYEQAYEQARKQAKQTTTYWQGQEAFVWNVEGEVDKAYGPAEQAYEQARQQAWQQAYQQVYKQAWQAPHPTTGQAEQAVPPLKQAYNMADAHWRTQASWGIGAGLLAAVLLLVGALAWSKLTAKA